MPPRRTPNHRAQPNTDLEDLLLAVTDKLAVDDPGWRTGLDARTDTALVRLKEKRGPRPPKVAL